MAEVLHRAAASDVPEALLRELKAFRGTARDLPAHIRDLLGRLALHSMFELVGVLAGDGTLLEVNERALALAGVGRDAVVGLPLWDACAPWIANETVARLEGAVRRASEGQFVRDEADAFGLPGPDPLTLDYSLWPVVDGSGAVAFVVAEARDVTAMRRAHEGLRRELAGHAGDVRGLADELARRKRELEAALHAMRSAREQADRAKAQTTRLRHMVSDELRAPLAALLVQLDRLRREAAGPASHHGDAVARVRSALGRLSSLVDSLLEYSRIEAGRTILEPTPVDPAALATEVVRELEPLAAGKDLALVSPAAGSVSPLETDPRLLRLVLSNLVQNAIRFTLTGSVSVCVTVANGEHRLSVRDTGRGFSSEDQARLFEPFDHLDQYARKCSSGAGLGLSLVREMVGALGGSIALESRPGVGSTFTVTLPSERGEPGHAHGPSPGPAR